MPVHVYADRFPTQHEDDDRGTSPWQRDRTPRHHRMPIRDVEYRLFSMTAGRDCRLSDVRNHTEFKEA
jgi:hypothetical protein